MPDVFLRNNSLCSAKKFFINIFVRTLHCIIDSASFDKFQIILAINEKNTSLKNA